MDPWTTRQYRAHQRRIIREWQEQISRDNDSSPEVVNDGTSDENEDFDVGESVAEPVIDEAVDDVEDELLVIKKRPRLTVRDKPVMDAKKEPGKKGKDEDTSRVAFKQLAAMFTRDSNYISQDWEHFADTMSHGFAVIVSLAQSAVLLAETPSHGFVTMLVFCIGLNLMFAISTIYHIVRWIFGLSNHTLLRIVQRFDRIGIYLFVASFLHPWFVFREFNNWFCNTHLWWCMWVLTTIGAVFELFCYHRYVLSVLMYSVIMGAPIPLVLLFMEDQSGFIAVSQGMVFMAYGVFYFKLDGHVPFAHTIWHLHVNVTTMYLVYSMRTFLIPSIRPPNEMFPPEWKTQNGDGN